MKIFVTVGTTIFDSLIKFVDEHFSKENHDITLQISEGKYLPKNFKYFKFSEHIDQYYTECDVAITHAGAGSVYRLLELKKKIIIVPNMERTDKHQMEIAKYMHDEGYALMCVNFEKLHLIFNKIMIVELKEFKKEEFFAHFQIGAKIKALYLHQ